MLIRRTPWGKHEFLLMFVAVMTELYFCCCIPVSGFACFWYMFKWKSQALYYTCRCSQTNTRNVYHIYICFLQWDFFAWFHMSHWTTATVVLQLSNTYSFENDHPGVCKELLNMSQVNQWIETNIDKYRAGTGAGAGLRAFLKWQNSISIWNIFHKVVFSKVI